MKVDLFSRYTVSVPYDKRMNKDFLRAFFPPLALAVFPILFLFSHNRAELLFHELWLPLGAAFVSALAAFLAAFVLLR